MPKLGRKTCKYGKKCFRKNEDHLKNYSHKNSDDAEKEEASEKKVIENLIECKKDEDSGEKSRESNGKRKAEEELEDKKDNKRKAIDDEEHLKQDEKIEKIDVSKKDIKELVLEYNKMEMPEDFYSFVDFCKTIDEKNPKNALKLIDIELTGIYDLILNGYKLDYKVHSRYFYDPPEFQTVLNVNNSESLLHFGYFRDDPKEMPCFVGINEANKDCVISPKGENIFAALSWYLDELMSKKRNFKCDASLDDLKNLSKKLSEWCANKKQFPLTLKSAKIKAREKKTNCKTFHQAGIVVPVDSNGFGYRDSPETYDSLRKAFKNVTDESDPDKKRKADDKIQEIITLIQFANDETDYGMGLEFGLNMFSSGNVFLHKYIKNVLPVCYDLLGRHLYAEILREHLKQRTLNQ